MKLNKLPLKMKKMSGLTSGWNFGLLLLLLIISPISVALANDDQRKFENANAAYAKGDYEQSIQLYESILADDLESAALYFNLGNAYFKSNDIANAILNFERAKKLDPANEDILFNLKLANQQIEDKIDVMPTLFLTEWKEGIMNQLTEKQWSLYFIFALFLSLFLFMVYVMANTKTIKQLGFFGGAFLFVFSIFLFFSAKNKYQQSKNSSQAIITAATLTATGSPSESGTKLFVLHKGTKVNINQEGEHWTEIKIANGNVGWVKSETLEAI